MFYCLKAVTARMGNKCTIFINTLHSEFAEMDLQPVHFLCPTSTKVLHQAANIFELSDSTLSSFSKNQPVNTANSVEKWSYFPLALHLIRVNAQFLFSLTWHSLSSHPPSKLSAQLSVQSKAKRKKKGKIKGRHWIFEVQSEMGQVTLLLALQHCQQVMNKHFRSVLTTFTQMFNA